MCAHDLKQVSAHFHNGKHLSHVPCQDRIHGPRDSLTLRKMGSRWGGEGTLGKHRHRTKPILGIQQRWQRPFLRQLLGKESRTGVGGVRKIKTSLRHRGPCKLPGGHEVARVWHWNSETDIHYGSGSSTISSGGGLLWWPAGVARLEQLGLLKDQQLELLLGQVIQLRLKLEWLICHRLITRVIILFQVRMCKCLFNIYSSMRVEGQHLV